MRSRDGVKAVTGETGTKTPARRSPVWRRYLPLAVLAMAMAAFFATGFHRLLSFDAVLDYRGELQASVAKHGLLAIGGFIIVYTTAVALSVPGATLLTVMAGLLFGGMVGGAAAVFAATLGATLVFLIARSALGQSLAQKAGASLTRILDGFREDAASYMLFLRLVPIFPFWLVNLAPALAGVPLSTFLWTTLLGIVPGTFAFAFAGAGLDSVVAGQAAARASCLAAGRTDCSAGLDLKALVTPQLLTAFALLGLVALIPVIWRKLKVRSA